MEIHKAFSSCEYNDIIEKDFISLLQNHFHVKTNSHLYLFSRHKKSSKLFLLQTNIPSLFKGKYFDVSVLIYFPNNFPLIPPNFFIEKKCNLKVNPNCKFFINEENLVINYEKIIKWNNCINCVIDVIEELKKQFNINFPVLKTKDNLNDNGDCLIKNENIVLVEIKEIEKNVKDDKKEKKLNKNNINDMNMETNSDNNNNKNNNKNKKNDMNNNINNITNINNINNNNRSKSPLIFQKNNIKNNNNNINKNLNNLYNQFNNKDNYDLYKRSKSPLIINPKFNNKNNNLNKINNYNINNNYNKNSPINNNDFNNQNNTFINNNINILPIKSFTNRNLPKNLNLYNENNINNQINYPYSSKNVNENIINNFNKNFNNNNNFPNPNELDNECNKTVDNYKNNLNLISVDLTNDKLNVTHNIDTHNNINNNNNNKYNFVNPYLNEFNNNNNINSKNNLKPTINKIDFEKKRKNLILFLIKSNFSKIKKSKQINNNFNQLLLLEKKNILNDLEQIKNINEKNKFESIINLLNSEIKQYEKIKIEKFDLKNLSNLDEFLYINNKDYYMRIAKEDSLEEIIILIKKAFEKEVIDFDNAFKLMRSQTRNIFFLKYKNNLINNLN